LEWEADYPAFVVKDPTFANTVRERAMATLTEAQIKGQVDAIQADIERHKKQPRSKDKIFAAIRPEGIEKKVRTGSPFFIGASWDAAAPPGGIINLRTFISNPNHPDLAGDIYVHVWVGSGNVDPVVGTFLMNVDTRFPRLTRPGAFGLRPGMMAPDTGGFEPNVMSLEFNLKIPSEIEETNYLGNICLIQLGGVASIEAGQLLDRDRFVFSVPVPDEPPSTPQ
jgi:hypothetical protein